MEFQGFEPTLFQFLEELAENNNRPWFQENKGRYEREVLEPAMGFIRAFRPRLGRISRYFVASDRRVGGSLMRQAGAWLETRDSDSGVYLFVLEVNSLARRFYERLGARNAGVSTMETHGGAIVRSCRYVWPDPAALSAG